MTHWGKYFLAGVEETAKKSVETLSEELKLKATIEQQIPVLFKRNSQSASRLLQDLFVHPIVHVNDVIKICGLSKKQRMS